MLKLFCNSCHKFVKEIEPIKASKLTGLEVCPDCSGKMAGAIEEITKIANRACMAINKKADKAKADLEIAMSKIIKGG